MTFETKIVRVSFHFMSALILQTRSQNKLIDLPKLTSFRDRFNLILFMARSVIACWLFSRSAHLIISDTRTLLSVLCSKCLNKSSNWYDTPFRKAFSCHRRSSGYSINWSGAKLIWAKVQLLWRHESFYFPSDKHPGILNPWSFETFRRTL